MKWYFMIMGLMAYAVISAQPYERVISTSGASVTNNGLIQMSVGEPIIGTLRSGDIVLTQGFLQVFKTPVSNREHTDSKHTFNLFPNPSDGRITLLHDLPDGSDFNVFVYDLMGKRVYSSPGKNDNTLDLSHLSPAIYFMQIQQEQHTYSIKFEKF